MSESVSLRDYDEIESEYENMVNQFYRDLGSCWSRTIPEYARSDLYEEDRLMVGREGEFRVVCFRSLESNDHFLAIQSKSTIFGDVDIEVMVAEVPDSGVRSFRHADIGGSPAKYYVHKETVEKDGEYTPEVVYTVLRRMLELSEEYNSYSR